MTHWLEYTWTYLLRALHDFSCRQISWILSTSCQSRYFLNIPSLLQSKLEIEEKITFRNSRSADTCGMVHIICVSLASINLNYNNKTIFCNLHIICDYKLSYFSDLLHISNMKIYMYRGENRVFVNSLWTVSLSGSLMLRVARGIQRYSHYMCAYSNN